MRTDITYSPTFGVRAELCTTDPKDPKPWAAWPEGEAFETTIKLAWGSSPDEAVAQWGALYYGTERKHLFAGRIDMIQKEKADA